MSEITAHRTLVKSPPEVWAQLSDAEALARHLDDFGEIRITRVEPETTVAWEAERVSGEVLIDPSGWGTRVTMTARVPGAPEPAEPAPAAEAAGPQSPSVDAPDDELPDEPPASEAEPAEETPASEARAELDALPPPATDRAARFHFISRFFPRTVPEPLADPGPPPVAETPQTAPPLEPVPDLEPEPEPEPVPAPPDPAPEPVPEPEPEPTPWEPIEPPTAPDQPDPPFEPAALSAPGRDSAGPGADPGPGPDAALAVLNSVLDDLGSAHHRPFSRG